MVVYIPESECEYFMHDGDTLLTPDGRTWIWRSGGYYLCIGCAESKHSVKAFIENSMNAFRIHDEQHICPEKDFYFEKARLEKEEEAAKERGKERFLNSQRTVLSDNNSNISAACSHQGPKFDDPTNSNQPMLPRSQKRKRRAKSIAPKKKQIRRSRSTLSQYSISPVIPNTSNNNAQTRQFQSRYLFHHSDHVPEMPINATPMPPPISVTSSANLRSRASSVYDRREHTTTNSTLSSREQSSFRSRQPSLLAPPPRPIQNRTFSHEDRSQVRHILLNPSQINENEESDDDAIQILEEEIQILEDTAAQENNTVMLDIPCSSQTTFPQKSEAPLPAQYYQQYHGYRESYSNNITEGPDNDSEVDNGTGYQALSTEQEMEEKVFGEDKYDPAILTFNRPSERSLKVAAKQLGLSYSPECYDFWSKIKIDVIKSRSDSIKTGTKPMSAFDCLALFLTGTSKLGDTLWKNVNHKLEGDSLMKEAYNLQKRYEMTLNFCADHLKLICYWLSCRIGVYQNGELTKYGDWRRSSESNDLIILIEKIGDKYSPIFSL